MAQNFKKHTGGPTKAATHGRPSDPKTIGTMPTPQKHGQFQKVGKHPGRPTAHEPPNTVKARGVRQANPTPSILKPHGETSSMHTMQSMSQHHSTVQGTRTPTSGGQSVRPYAGMGDAVHPHSTMQQHTMAGTPRIPHTVGMTKKIRGMIGKPRKRHAKLY